MDALAHIHLAEEGEDAAVGTDGDPGIELVGGKCRLAGIAGGSGNGGQVDRADERAGAPQEITPGKRKFAHCSLPQPVAAARLTARRMARWVPQRHLRPESPSRISRSLGCGLSLSSAAAVIIQP